MKPSKPINDWRQIFLDTSVIIDFLSDPNRFTKNPPVKERIELVHELINLLSSHGHTSRPNRSFYISAITVGELKHLAHPTTTRDVVSIFSGADIVFVDFTKDIALHMNNHLESSLTSNQAREWSQQRVSAIKDASTHHNVRQWLADDMKIVASAKSVKALDVVLTSDHKTFKPVADLYDVPCVCMKKEEFPTDMFGDIEPTIAFR